jgi:hypothetical protein
VITYVYLALLLLLPVIVLVLVGGIQEQYWINEDVHADLIREDKKNWVWVSEPNPRDK